MSPRLSVCPLWRACVFIPQRSCMCCLYRTHNECIPAMATLHLFHPTDEAVQSA
uniref:Uncharacterized protein n=1 Tax=Anguilla anguilla TaxID=7936 RepID=A0A0E9W5U2_ANGAN